jgi:hypothetical protein
VKAFAVMMMEDDDVEVMMMKWKMKSRMICTYDICCDVLYDDDVERYVAGQEARS